ncbi:MAG: HEAT repeat domain-containing protein [Synechococcaceae cyanobacterium]|nr:HEAT repeat domain-containing protein [Synechococcaceae cyanobacterium]
MNPSLLAPLAALLVALLWWSSRRRPQVDPSRDISAVTALNRAQIALVQSPQPSPDPFAAPLSPAAVTTAPAPANPLAPLAPAALQAAPRSLRQLLAPPAGRPVAAIRVVMPEPCFETPRSVAQRRMLLRQLGQLARGDDRQRRQAMKLARRWGDRAALPLLRRGLHDPDPQVMREAALAIERFRGRPQAPVAAAARVQPAPPRNVSRTR